MRIIGLRCWPRPDHVPIRLRCADASIKPTALKLLAGNPGKRPLNTDEPRPEGALLDKPEWMTEGQRAGWTYTIAHAPRGLLKQLDRSELAVWLVAEDPHRHATEQIARYGNRQSGPYGNG